MHKLIFFSFLFLLSHHSTFGQTIHTAASTVTFEVSNFGMGSVEGSFGGMKGDISFDANDLSNATFEVCIDAQSIDTGNQKRDDHLKAEDFFEVEKYPSICFSSNKIVKTDSGFKTIGTLNMHGVTRTEEIDFTYDGSKFQGNLTVNRLDYKIGPSGGFMVGKEVEIQIACTLN